ncbi:MAG: HNH endonuclease, partial [Candidatus Coatesbacteria bacterium]
MKTYLLSWNPEIWEWDDLDDEINTIKEKGFVEGRWSCGRTKIIKPGDYFFLIRLGKEPKGIFASGRIISDVYEDEHWNEERY